VLGGVTVEHPLGLAGHSDADVVCHAAIDSLLGAAAMDDIGALFPDTDPAYAGADSLELLAEVGRRLSAAGWRIGNVDVTVVAEAPKLAPYREQMRGRMAAALGLQPKAVTVKATTTEGMGFTGRDEGIAAYAVCLVETAG
jgi:2-C-methyl-D-erythritol 2,4-cyclodiphosphate synthase